MGVKITMEEMFDDQDDDRSEEVDESDDIAITLNEIMEENTATIDALVGGKPGKREMLRQLLQDTYIRAFCSGMRTCEEAGLDDPDLLAPDADQEEDDAH